MEGARKSHEAVRDVEEMAQPPCRRRAASVGGVPLVRATAPKQERLSLRTKIVPIGDISMNKEFEMVATLLSLDGAAQLFEGHLQTEYAQENLWFWETAMKFRSTTFESPELQREEARRIYNNFLSMIAPDQVSINDKDRESILASLDNKAGAHAVTPHLFDKALIQVEQLLLRGHFPRFAGNTVKNIEKSWAKLTEKITIDDAGEALYSLLFMLAPNVQSMFTKPKRVQGKMLMSIVNSAVSSLNNLDQLTPVLLDLGIRHKAYKVRREHYPVVGEALIATLGKVLGQDFTAEIQQSWEVVYSLISKIMISVLDPDEPEEMTAAQQNQQQPQQQQQVPLSAEGEPGAVEADQPEGEHKKADEIDSRDPRLSSSNGGMNREDLVAGPSARSDPVDVMRSIILGRGKEKGWTESQLLQAFQEGGSKDERTTFDRFHAGLAVLGLTMPEDDERVVFKKFDVGGSGKIDLTAFTRWCLDTDTTAGKAEFVRKTSAATLNRKVLHPLGRLIYEGSKLFWRNGESLRIAMHENKDMNCVTISTMLEGGSRPFPVIQVDSRLIPVNGKDAVLGRVAEITQADRSGTPDHLQEEARAELFDKARASVLSEFLLARLQLVDSDIAGATDGRLGTGEGGELGKAPADAPAITTEGEAAAAATKAGTKENIPETTGAATHNSAPTSPSVFPKGTPTPMLVMLPEDDGPGGQERGGAMRYSSLLMKEKLSFSEVHDFSESNRRGTTPLPPPAGNPKTETSAGERRHSSTSPTSGVMTLPPAGRHKRPSSNARRPSTGTSSKGSPQNAIAAHELVTGGREKGGTETAPGVSESRSRRAA